MRHIKTFKLFLEKISYEENNIYSIDFLKNNGQYSGSPIDFTYDINSNSIKIYTTHGHSQEQQLHNNIGEIKLSNNKSFENININSDIKYLNGLRLPNEDFNEISNIINNTWKLNIDKIELREIFNKLGVTVISV